MSSQLNTATTFPATPSRLSGRGAQSRPAIALLLPNAWGVRNYVYSGILNQLAESGARIHVLGRGDLGDPAHPDASDFSGACSIGRMISPPARHIPGKNLIDELLRAAFMRRARNASYGLYRRWFRRGQSRGQRFRSGAVEAAAIAAHQIGGVGALGTLADTLYRRGHDLDGIREQLRTVKPDLVWSTTCVDAFEQPYLLAARDLGIPVLASIHSFDNLTSRGKLPVFQYYTVWNDRMKAQLLRFYSQVDPSSVYVTGTAQFDFHNRSDYRWSRSRTMSELGLQLHERYFLYFASVKQLAPAEPDVVFGLLSRLASHSELQHHRVVLRPHPLDDPGRWRHLTDAFPQLVLSLPWSRAVEAEHWCVSAKQDQSRLVSSLLHCDAAINIASTASLDAAAVDRPVVCLRLDRDAAAPREILWEEYDAEHYRPLVDSDGIAVARTWDETLHCLEEAVFNPEARSDRRRSMARDEAGTMDGHAADRITRAVHSVLAATRSAKQQPLSS